MKKSKLSHLALPHEVYLTYEEGRSGRVPEGDSDWPCYSDEIITFAPTGLFITRTSWQETISVGFNPSDYRNKTVHIVVVRYTDGDSFGRSLGHWKVIGGYLNPDDAKKIAKIISEDAKLEDKAKWERYSLLTKQKEKEWSKAAIERAELFAKQTAPFVGKHFYASWKGYFSSFEDVEIHDMPLQEKSETR